MTSLNVVILAGRLTRDPELRYTPNGVPVAHFTLAVNRTRGSQKDETDFIDIVAWNKLAEICQQYLSKGRLVSVVGRLQIRNYETQDGQKRKAVEVIANDMQILDRPANKPEEVGAKVAVQPAENGDSVKVEEPVQVKVEEPPLTDDVPF